MLLKEKLTNRTLTVLPHEKKKLEILQYSGWVIVEEESKPEVKPTAPVPHDVVVAVVEEPVIEEAVAEPVIEMETVVEPNVVISTDDVVEGEVENAGEVPEFPMPATEPRKARLHAPKVKKTLKLPNDYA